MTAAVRHQTICLDHPDPVAVFALRCWARATLWQAGEIDLHDAVDQLQAAAERDGLIAELGKDAVQAIMATALGAVRDDLGGDLVPDSTPASYLDEEDEAPKRNSAATSTLQAAEYLVRERDADRLHRWLAKHGAEERAAIKQHLGRNRQ
jgi:hypothetical protein